MTGLSYNGMREKCEISLGDVKNSQMNFTMKRIERCGY